MVKDTSKYLIINDHILPESDFNESLVTGDTLYEVIRIVDGIPLFLDDHLSRLVSSARLSANLIWLERKTIELKIYQLLRLNQMEAGNIEISFTFKKRPLAQIFMARIIPHKYPEREDYSQGVNVSFYSYKREKPNAKIKNLSLREITNQMIKNEGVYEVVLVDEASNILEGSRSNLFFLKDKTIYTAPAKDVLCGITRKYVIEICKMAHIPVVEQKINMSELSGFEAMFISGTSPGILPIQKAGQFHFRTDGKLLRGLMKEYQDFIIDYINEKKQSLKL